MWVMVVYSIKHNGIILGGSTILFLLERYTLFFLYVYNGDA